MFSRLNHVGLNITKSKLQLVEIVRESSKYCLENVDEEIFEEEFNFNSEEEQIISILQASFDSLTSRTPLKSNNISVSIPLRTSEIFEIPCESSLSQTALNEHILWEFSVLYPMLNSDDYIVRTLPLASREKQNRILVVALPKKIAKAIHSFSIQNNLNLKSIDNSHFSFDSTLNLQENKSVLSLYLCTVCCSINSYLGKNIQTTLQFEVSSNDSLVNSVAEFIESQNIAYDKIYLGSDLDLDELKDNLELKLNAKVETINPFESLVVSESFIQNAYFLNKPTSFTAAAGISYRKI